MLAAKPRTDDSTDVVASVIVMTPENAAYYLGRNTKNRNVRPTVVERYARDMVAGDWELNGETIKVAQSGVILDGQHRLAAVVAAGVPVPMFVVSGLPDSVQDTVDRGLPRNMADALRLHGEQNVNLLAGAISQALILEISPGQYPTAAAWPSTREGLHYLEENPGIRESVPLGERMRSTIGYPGSSAIALHYVLSKRDRQDADTFFDLAATGVGLAADSPILKLRDLMLREITAQRRMSRVRMFALSIKAWNAWRRGEPLQVLRWSTGGSKPESFPIPE